MVNATPGKLKEAITALGKDYTTLRNLKITGEINAKDFYFMRDHMPRLTALNLKEVRIKAMCKPGEGEEGYDDQIPGSAFYYQHTNGGSQSLTRIILPAKSHWWQRVLWMQQPHRIACHSGGCDGDKAWCL